MLKWGMATSKDSNAVMEEQPVSPNPWPAVLLATLPGLLSVVWRALDLWHVSGFYAPIGILGALLILVSLAWRRGLAVWTLPAAGLLLSTGPGLLLDLFFPGPGSPPRFFDTLVNLWFLLSMGVAVFLIWRQRRRLVMARGAWILLLVLFLSGLAFDGIFLAFMILGFLALPFAVGLPFVRRHGLAAGLLPVAGTFWLVDSIWDPSYYLPAEAAQAVELLLAVGFLILVPLVVLRARTAKGQLAGLVIPPAVVIILCELIRVGTYPPGYSAELWLTRGTGALQITLLILLAGMVYRAARRSPDLRAGAGSPL